MKYVIELISYKGNTFHTFEGTEAEARIFARNLIIKKGKNDWIAIIFAHPDIDVMNVIDSIWYGETPQTVGKWVCRSYIKRKHGIMNADGTVKYRG